MNKYLCQDCRSNNNGWCTVRKCNGLKKLNITSCNTFEGKNKIEFTNGSKIETIKTDSVAKGKRAELKPVDDYCDMEYKSESYRVLGKREMLWKIQMQIVGINQEEDMSYEEKYNALVGSIKSIGIHLEFEEKLWEMDGIIDSMIDEDMVEYSRNINKLI